MNKKRPLADQGPRDRIVSELQRNLLVESGAGSGKTHEMTRRMAAGIASGAYKVEHIAAVTFTRKAAAELRGRFQLALEKNSNTAGSMETRPNAMPASTKRYQISNVSLRALSIPFVGASFAKGRLRRAFLQGSPNWMKRRTRYSENSLGETS
jgi:UvrD-like helicase family protein